MAAPGEKSAVCAQRAGDGFDSTRIADVGHQLIDLPAQERIVDGGAQQSFFGAEVPADRATADSGAVADRGERGVAVPVFSEQLGGPRPPARHGSALTVRLSLSGARP